MNKHVARLGAAAVAASAMVTISPLTYSPAQAAVACSTSAYAEVDGTRGVVVIYPSVRCAGETVTLTVDGFAIENDPDAVIYDGNPNPAGTYTGNGVELPNRGSGEYCAVVDAEWTNWGPDMDHGAVQKGDARSRHCVTI